MASSQYSERPSTPAQMTREDSVTPPEYKPNSSPSKIFSIQSILNPSGPGNAQVSNGSQLNDRSPIASSPSPALTSSTCLRSGTPGTPPSIKGKKDKNAVVFNRGPPTSGANYLPFESSDRAICLSESDRQELMHQHSLFQIKPSEKDGEGQIRNFTRYIPYSTRSMHTAE